MELLKTNTLIEKNSKFIAQIYEVKSEEEVKEILKALNKEYRDARHIVYAYRINVDGQVKAKYTDDREPKGTAGRPILYMLEQKERMNVLAVVIRYFGGTLLGKGGLVRAYTNSVKEVL
jgi:uncharacterized YigZ family protein